MSAFTRVLQVLLQPVKCAFFQWLLVMVYYIYVVNLGCILANSSPLLIVWAHVIVPPPLVCIQMLEEANAWTNVPEGQEDPQKKVHNNVIKSNLCM